MSDGRAVLTSAVLAALGYIGLLAAGLAVAGHVFGIGYYDPGFGLVMLPFEAAMSLLALLVAHRLFGHWSCGYGALRWRGLVVLAPFVAMVALLFAAALRTATPQWSVAAAAMVATMLLLGFSEELMFRGIVLRGALPAIGRRRAILLSAALFALMHGANLLALLPVWAVAQQMCFTLLLGIALGSIALRLDSLVPLMILHATWDVVQFLGMLWQADFGTTGRAVFLVSAGMALLLWIAELRRRDVSSLSKTFTLS